MAPLPTDTAYMASEFIQTFTGRSFYPLAPRTADVCIIDIAHALSNQCRFGGHSDFFYSVAQHCCLLADYVESAMKGTPLDCLQILIHDAAEAYLVDLPRPIKQHIPEFRQYDYQIQMCIRSWLGLGDVPVPSWQDEVDSRIIHDEHAQVMSESSDWQHQGKPLGVTVVPWNAMRAEQNFLLRYSIYTHKIFGAHQYLRSGWGIPTHSIFHDFPFKTGGADVSQYGKPNPEVITDLIEVDLRGGVGRIVLRSENGMLIRDTNAGTFPRPAWDWLHGNFQLATPHVNDVQLEMPKEEGKQ